MGPRLVSDSDTAAILVKKHNNFYLQSQIPASDYHYSWVTSSLGNNYSVRSGNQKVFGFWPKDHKSQGSTLVKFPKIFIFDGTH